MRLLVLFSNASSSLPPMFVLCTNKSAIHANNIPISKLFALSKKMEHQSSRDMPSIVDASKLGNSIITVQQLTNRGKIRFFEKKIKQT
jgi:hypothetical protein